MVGGGQVLDGAGEVPLKTAEVLARRLRWRIATGDLRAGDRLPPEDELMARYEVARTTLREGLRILESQGLIEVRRGRGGGPQVTTPPPDLLALGLALHLQLRRATIDDLDEARALVEPWLAARLAGARTEADLAALAAAINTASDAADSGDGVAFAEAAAVVHETVARGAGNQTLGLLAELLRELVADFHRSGTDPASIALMQRGVRSYRKLHRLVADGDAAGAEEHWRRHIAVAVYRRDRDAPLDAIHEV